LRAQLETLQALDASKDDALGQLTDKNTALEVLVDQLQRKIAELEKRLSKNSTNSSLPPSSDLFSKKRPESPNRAARRALGRKPGKQPGTEGNHLAQVADPDAIETHSPVCCDGCGADLADAPVEDDVEVRQVTEIPVPVAMTTEHRAEKRRCVCGVVTKAQFPAHVRSFHSYGPRLRAFALYLLSYQHLPFERAAEAMRDLFGVSVSTGFLDSLYSEGASSLEDFSAAVLAHLKAADVVHMDETPIRCATNPKAWIHVACTELLTLLHADETRGKDGIERLGLFPDFEGVAVHDRLGWYSAYGATHALCGQHLLRDLASVGVVFSQTGWTSAMTALLLEMKHAGEEARAKHKPALAPSVLRRMNNRYDAIVAEALAANPDPGRKRDTIETESHNLAKAFGERQDDITRFATDLRVPFTNNIAESALRMAKLRLKIGGCFRSLQGAERLAAVRSYLQSAKKHSLEPIAVLTDLFNGEPWIPQRI